jgi:hypothetical protein
MYMDIKVSATDITRISSIEKNYNLDLILKLSANLTNFYLNLENYLNN